MYLLHKKEDGSDYKTDIELERERGEIIIIVEGCTYNNIVI